MKLIAYSTTESGGMMGGYSSKSVNYTDDGRCKVATAYRPYHSQPTQHVTYYADGLLEKMSEVCEKYNVLSWTNLPDQEIFMHDASTTSDCFTFEDGTKITLSSKKKYPENAGDLYKELDRLIIDSESYAVDAEVTEEEFMNMGMMMFNQIGNGSLPQATSKKVEVDTSNLAKFCPDCGKAFMDHQLFCAQCGSKRPMMRNIF